MNSHPLNPTAEEGRKAAARAEVADQARQGRAPCHVAGADVIAWAFEGYATMLANLEETARAVRDDRVARHRAAELRNKVHALTERVLKEWDEQERLDRRKRAEAEAKKRLGIK